MKNKEYKMGDPLPGSRPFVLLAEFSKNERSILTEGANFLARRNYTVPPNMDGPYMGLDNDTVAKTRKKLLSLRCITLFDRSQQWTLYAGVIELMVYQGTPRVRSIPEDRLTSLSTKLMRFRGFRNEYVMRKR